MLLAISLIAPICHHHAFPDNHHGITADHHHDDLDESWNHENIDGSHARGGMHLHLTKVINIFCSRFDLQTVVKKTGTIKEFAFIPESSEDSRLFAAHRPLIRTKAGYYENLSGLSPPVA